MNEFLDLGCGSKPKGTINLDLHFEENIHHRHTYDLSKTVNFIIGDASNLPFRDNCIKKVNGRHLLEHLPEPLLSVRDWKRVALEYVTIKVPNNPSMEEFKEHLYSWSLVSFKSFLELTFDDVVVKANSPMSDLWKNKVCNKLLRISLVKKPMQRFLCKWLGLELAAVCTL